jgi:hypothetical protein
MGYKEDPKIPLFSAWGMPAREVYFGLASCFGRAHAGP